MVFFQLMNKNNQFLIAFVVFQVFAGFISASDKQQYSYSRPAVSERAKMVAAEIDEKTKDCKRLKIVLSDSFSDRPCTPPYLCAFTLEQLKERILSFSKENRKIVWACSNAPEWLKQLLPKQQ